jgi:predicted anti-sigma-YlaC factor YlaD
MKCKTIRAITKRSSGDNIAQVAVAEVAAHIETCSFCRNSLLLDRLAPAIIKAASVSGQWGVLNTPSATLINRVRSRIQEMREQRSASWEFAIESMRGWLAAFAVAAAILVAVSIQWRPATTAGDFYPDGDEAATLNPSEYFISDVPD